MVGKRVQSLEAGSPERKTGLDRAIFNPDGYAHVCIQGGSSPRDQVVALSQFNCGESFVVLTIPEVAGELGFQGVQHVVNYDMPRTMKEYDHRMRCLQHSGTQVLIMPYFTEGDKNIVKDLIGFLVAPKQEVSPGLRT